MKGLEKNPIAEMSAKNERFQRCFRVFKLNPLPIVVKANVVLELWDFVGIVDDTCLVCAVYADVWFDVPACMRTTHDAVYRRQLLTHNYAFRCCPCNLATLTVLCAYRDVSDDDALVAHRNECMRLQRMQQVSTNA